MAAAAARTIASASSSPAVARSSLAVLLFSKRFSAISSAGAASVSRLAGFGPFSSPSPDSDESHDVAALVNCRVNYVRSMVSLAGNETLEIRKDDGDHVAAFKELYEKMLNSLKAKTMPPNAWLWSLIEKCSDQDDTKLLFQMLENLRRFRLSSLRIHANFNCHLCLKVTEACARAGAIEYGKKALWKHNVYGLTPSIGSAHYLLLYAKEHNDSKLMVEIMKLLKSNSLPLQPGTADIVFSICCNTDRWDLISKYSKAFIKAGVKLRQTAFDIWMEFAAKIGDSQAVWEIEKLRSNTIKQHTVSSAFSCAKGFILEHKPESAAAIIHVLNQNLSEQKRSNIAVELQKLVSEWPVAVIKRQKKDRRKELANSLRNDIPKMINSLLSMGLEVTVNLEELTC